VVGRRREIGLAAGETAGSAIAELYAELYGVPVSAVAEAGRLRGLAAEVRDRGANADPDGPTGRGAGYWPEVGRLLTASYRSLKAAVASSPSPQQTRIGSRSSRASRQRGQDPNI
jgi:hypothetical protein